MILSFILQIDRPEQICTKETQFVDSDDSAPPTPQSKPTDELHLKKKRRRSNFSCPSFSNPPREVMRPETKERPVSKAVRRGLPYGMRRADSWTVGQGVNKRGDLSKFPPGTAL